MRRVATARPCRRWPCAVGGDAAGVRRNGRCGRRGWVGAPSASAADDPASSGEAEPAEATGGSLATVARAAAMKAERALIEKTLTQVHWNRRKASQILGVSYKTLLNKIKECSITRD